MNLKRNKTFTIFILTIALGVYLIFLTRNSRAFVDVWPLEGVFWETTAVIIAITLLSYILFRGRASVIIPLITLAFLVVVIPVLKLPNALNLTGPWDSVAHYSFAKWILVNGRVDTVGNLYYSGQYGFHPGNGILPSSLSLLSSISLGWSMNAVLIAVYLGYMLFLVATLKRLGHLESGSMNIDIIKVLWLIAIFTLSIPLHVYYGGVELGYIYAGGVLYAFIRWLMRDDYASVRSLMLMLIVFLGVLSTHLSTAVIIVAYILISMLTLLIIKPFSKNPMSMEAPLRMLAPAILLTSIFILYEIYIDVFLFGNTLKGAIHAIYSLYVREIEIARVAVETRGLTFIDLLQYLVSAYAKSIIILGLIVIHTVTLLLKSASLSYEEKKLFLLLLASYTTWIIGWSGVGSFLSGARAFSVICFLLSINIVITYEKLYGFLIKKNLFIIPLFLMALGFATNFGLPFQPTIKIEEDSYTYPTLSQGGFSDYVLHPTTFVSSHVKSSPFLCLSPYITFGLCDLMWHSPRVPRSGFIAPKVTAPDGIIEIVRGYLNRLDRDVIIPQLTRDRVLPGPIGYRSLYEKPLLFLLEKGKALIYNNGICTLFLV